MFDVKDARVMTSTEALELRDIPKKLLVVGGGYIGMELGTVYAALGSEVTVAEALDGILLGADADLVRFVQERAAKIFKEVRLNAQVLQLKPLPDGIEVRMAVGAEEKREVYDRVLVSIGRTPNGQGLGLERTKVRVDSKGFIQVDARQRTSEPDIYAIGDVTGGMMLAHKASKDAKVAVDMMVGGAAAGKESLIPAVVFTDPELAWCGLTEAEAKAKNISVQIVKFPWSASGRALTLERTDGATKLLVDSQTGKILGVGICGAGAGELISEGLMAVEMGLRAQDLARIVHPHPTLSETLMECAEMFYGHATHAYSRKRV
jgi:dihydrolipoamide dehydrogenase